MHFGHGVIEIDVMPRFVFERQSVGARYAAVSMEHGFVGVDGDGRMHDIGMFAGHVDGGHEVGQFAAAVDDTFYADRLCLGQQFVDTVDGHFGLALFCGFMAHGSGEGHDGGHMRVIVDDVRVVGKGLWGRGPATVAMVFAHRT